MPLSTAQSSTYQAILNPGSSSQAVRLSADHVRALIYIAARDTGVDGLPDPTSTVPGLFDDDFDLTFSFPGPPPRQLFELALSLNAELETYVGCLATIHKFRLKYRQVLSTQSFATMDQVGPRALLQYKQLDNRSLAALLTDGNVGILSTASTSLPEQLHRLRPKLGSSGGSARPMATSTFYAGGFRPQN